TLCAPSASKRRALLGSRQPCFQPRLARQGNHEAGPSTGFAADLNRSAVSLDDVANDVQSQSKAAEVFDRCRPLEGVDYPLQIRRSDRNALVPHGQSNAGLATFNRDFDRFTLSILQRV